MNKGKTLAIRIACILVLIGITVVMFIIGRGHTAYIDNKTIEYNGKEVASKYQIDVYYDGELVTELYKSERTSVKFMGQTLKLHIDVQEKKNNLTKTGYDIELPIPYNMDGILISLPAYLAELPEDAYMSEFIIQEENVDDSEVDLGDDMDITNVE